MLVWLYYDCVVLQNAAGTDVAAVVVGLGVLALGHTAAAGRMDEMEGVVVIAVVSSIDSRISCLEIMIVAILVAAKIIHFVHYGLVVAA